MKTSSPILVAERAIDGASVLFLILGLALAAALFQLGA